MEKFRFRALDSWRGICALMVALYHFEPLGRLYSGHIRYFPVVSNGWIFVDFFFVLSGFVIYYTYSQKLTNISSIINFFIRRFGRVWPLHAVVLLVLIATELLKFYSARNGAAIESPPFTEVYSIPSIFTKRLSFKIRAESLVSWKRSSPKSDISL